MKLLKIYFQIFVNNSLKKLINSNNKNEGNNEEDKQKKSNDAIKKFGDAPLDGSFFLKENKKNPKKKGCCG